MALAITRSGLSADDLRAQARRAKDGDVGLPVDCAGPGAGGSAALASGMDRQTLRDWVIRYNEAGVAGLRDLPRSGRRLRLNEAHYCGNISMYGEP